MTNSFQDCVYLPRYLYYLIMKRCANNSNFKLRTEKSVHLQFINEMEIPTSTNLHGSTLLPWIYFVVCMKNCRSATQRINWFFTDIWQLVIRHADTLICLQWYVLVIALRLSVYTLFGKNKVKFGQTFFASPKIWTPVQLWLPLSCLLVSDNNWRKHMNSQLFLPILGNVTCVI